MTIGRDSSITLLSFVDGAASSSVESEAVRKDMHDFFNVPRWFWSSLYLDSNGYFSATEIQDATSGKRIHNNFFRFLSKHASSSSGFRRDSRGSDVSYKWDKLGFCTQWHEAQDSLVLLCFDLPDPLKQQLYQELCNADYRISSTTPFGFASFLLPLIVQNFDRAVWSCRDLIRELESHRPNPIKPDLQYVRMHEIARHAIHSTEMLGTSLTVLDGMISELSRFAKCTGREEEVSGIERDLNFHRSTLRCLQLRSAALEDRLRNEINLVGNIEHGYSSSR